VNADHEPTAEERWEELVLHGMDPVEATLRILDELYPAEGDE
jgi:hypothetical protein